MRNATFAAIGLLLLAPSVAMQAQSSGEAAQRCETVRAVAIPPSAIGLPTRGAQVTGARLVAAATDGARPEYCEVTGEILPIDHAAPPIRFQVNLPTEWNAKALHMGGGGFDGTVVTGLGAVPRAPDTARYPIARGYVTFGSDSGHEGNDATFAANAEALTNFAYAQLKKTHDVAMALVKARYGRLPEKVYFAGQSEGGREGLTVAQRFPQDYDGIVVTAPAIRFVNIMMHFSDVATALAQPGGFLSLSHVKAFAAAVLAQCDLNDGAADGIVGNYLGCAFDASRLHCGTAAATADGCFTEAQRHTLETVYRATSWKDDAGNVLVSYPRYLVGGGEDKPGAMPAWITGRAPLPRPQPAGKAMNAQQLGVGISSAYSNSAIRYLIANDPSLDTIGFNPQPYAKQLAATAALLASDDPNLAAFAKRGGKLIMLHNTADLAVSPVSTIDYHDALVRVLGRNTVQQFARLYIVPGGDHNGGGAPSKVDLLDMLDRWVVKREAPGAAVAQEFGADRHVTRSRPLCAYPAYPRYAGSGDINAAGNYRCVAAPDAKR